MLRPASIVALLVALAFSPLAVANAPPIPVALAQPEAVLGEPVTFTSASHDPDGTIAATSWEFSDGARRSAPLSSTHSPTPACTR